MKEKWRSVVGYEGIYEVSNIGGFRSLDRVHRHNYGGLMLKKGKTLKSRINNGYHAVTLVKDGVVTQTFLHRIVAKAFKKNPKNKPCVNHKDGNKSNNKSTNLVWATYLENQRHADATGLRDIRGEKNGRAKLSREDVSTILKLQETKTVSEIAKSYNVTYQNISLILKGKSWLSI